MKKEIPMPLVVGIAAVLLVGVVVAIANMMRSPSPLELLPGDYQGEPPRRSQPAPEAPTTP